jgi:hypothetical protein
VEARLSVCTQAMVPGPSLLSPGQRQKVNYSLITQAVLATILGAPFNSKLQEMGDGWKGGDAKAAGLGPHPTHCPSGTGCQS